MMMQSCTCTRFESICLPFKTATDAFDLLLESVRSCVECLT